MKDWYRILCFALLFTGVRGLLGVSRLREELRKAARTMAFRIEEKGRKSALEKREAIRAGNRPQGFLGKLDRALVYSTIRRRFPGMSAEKFLAYMCITAAFLMIFSGTVFGGMYGMLAPVIFASTVYIVIRCLEISALKKTGNDLPRLLDLLGSFAASGAVISGIFGQISIYMNEPLRTVLDECSAEGRISGDMSLAMLTMADKIEHPQFKQLIRNMEITSRHGEDIAGLVADTRRSLRDYIRESSERKMLLRESAINVFLLVLMSFAVLAITASMAETDVRSVLLESIPGRVTVGVFAAVLFMYFSQAASLYK